MKDSRLLYDRQKTWKSRVTDIQNEEEDGVTAMGACTSKDDHTWQCHVGRWVVVGNGTTLKNKVAIESIQEARASARVRVRRVVIFRPQ